MACNKNIVKLNLEVASSSPLLKVIVWALQYRISRGNGADENPPSSADNGMMDPGPEATDVISGWRTKITGSWKKGRQQT